MSLFADIMAAKIEYGVSGPDETGAWTVKVPNLGRHDDITEISGISTLAQANKIANALEQAQEFTRELCSYS